MFVTLSVTLLVTLLAIPPFYLKDVKVKYDEAVLKKSAPIDHEKAWGILAARTQAAKKREFEKIGKDEILRYIEKQKMDQTPIESIY